MRQAADQGHAEAQATLGALYQLGKGVPQDYAQAAVWYRKSAEQGCPFAQRAFGVLLSEGRGVPKDGAEAVMWFRLAAEQGEASAQVNLGAAYQMGGFVPRDFSECYFWYKVASAGRVNGVTEEDMAALLKFAASKLSPEALSRAQERARKWLAEHPTAGWLEWSCSSN
jgi:hypothetical protein